MHSIQEEMHKYHVKNTAFPFSTRIQLKTYFDMLLPPNSDAVKLSRQQLEKVADQMDSPADTSAIVADLMGDKNGISFEEFQKRVDRIDSFSEDTKLFLEQIGTSPLWWRYEGGQASFGPPLLTLDQIESKYDSQLRSLTNLKDTHIPLVTDLLHNLMRWTRKVKSENKTDVLRIFRTLEQICGKCYEQNFVRSYVEASKALIEFVRRYGKAIPTRLLSLIMTKAMISPKLAIGNFCMNAATTMLRVYCKYAVDKEYQIVDHLQSVFTNIMKNDSKKAELPIWTIKFVIKKYVYNCPNSDSEQQIFWKKLGQLWNDGYASKHTNVRRWAEVAYAYAKQYNLHKQLVPNEATQKKVGKNLKASKKSRSSGWNVDKLATWDEADVWKTAFGHKLHRKKPKGLGGDGDEDRDASAKPGGKKKRRKKRHKGRSANNSLDSDAADIIQQDVRLSRDTSAAMLERQWSIKSGKTGYTELIERKVKMLDGTRSVLGRRSLHDGRSRAGGDVGGDLMDDDASSMMMPTTDEELAQDNLRKAEEMANLEKYGPKSAEEKELEELSDLARKKYFLVNNSIFNDNNNPYVEHIRRELGSSKSALEYDNEDLMEFIENLQLAFLDRKTLQKYFPRWINGYMFLNFIRFDKEVVRQNVMSSRVSHKSHKYYDYTDSHGKNSEKNIRDQIDPRLLGGSGDGISGGITINIGGDKSNKRKSSKFSKRASHRASHRASKLVEKQMVNADNSGGASSGDDYDADFDCYDWTDEFFEGIWIACQYFWDQYLIEIGVAKIGEATAESMVLTMEQHGLSYVLQENDVEYNETIGNDYINHIVVGPEVAKIIAKEDREHPRWTHENRNSLIAAKLDLEQARNEFEKDFANMPILTHAIQEMYKDLHLLAHTIDKETKKLKLLATELTTQQLCLKDLEVKQKHLLKEKEQLLDEYGRAVKEKHEMMRILEINGKMDYVKHLEWLKEELARQANECTQYDVMLEYAWNTESKWMDLIILLLEVFKSGKEQEQYEMKENGLSPQTPITPNTPHDLISNKSIGNKQASDISRGLSVIQTGQSQQSLATGSNIDSISAAAASNAGGVTNKKSMSDSEVFDLLDAYCRFYLSVSTNENDERYQFWDDYIQAQWFSEYDILDRYDGIYKEYLRRKEEKVTGFLRIDDERARKTEQEFEFEQEWNKQQNILNLDLYIPIESMRLKEYVHVLHKKKKEIEKQKFLKKQEMERKEKLMQTRDNRRQRNSFRTDSHNELSLNLALAGAAGSNAGGDDLGRDEMARMSEMPRMRAKRSTGIHRDRRGNLSIKFDANLFRSAVGTGSEPSSQPRTPESAPNGLASINEMENDESKDTTVTTTGSLAPSVTSATSASASTSSASTGAGRDTSTMTLEERRRARRNRNRVITQSNAQSAIDRRRA